VLHLDLSRYDHSAEDEAAAGGTSLEAPFDAMLRNCAACLPEGSRAAHVLCGPQTHAKANRASLAAVAGGTAGAGKARPFTVAYASGADGVACWTASLTSVEAAALADSVGFFHVSPVPPAAKLAPDLVYDLIKDLATSLSDRRLAPATGTIQPKPPSSETRPNVDLSSHGHKVMAYFDPSHADASTAPETEALVEAWRVANFGFNPKGETGGGDAAKAHFATGRGWQGVHSSVAGTDCSRHLDVAVTIEGLRGGRLHFTRLSDGDEESGEAGNEAGDACCLAALAFVAAQPEVHSIALVAAPRTVAAITPASHAASAAAVVAAAARDPGHARSLHALVAAHALQSGEVESTPLWDMGVTGQGQVVQVADTGFDDASCFLRDTGSATSLTGHFNGAFQVARSTWDSPVTDRLKRKVVQYVSFKRGGEGHYEQDYAGGHGTSVAGAVAGSIADGDGSTAAMSPADLYEDCAAFAHLCASVWQAHVGCDLTCGVARAFDEYRGLAPDAQLMVHDLGSANGTLLGMPDDYATELFLPAYRAGARIATNSWGSGTTYAHHARDVDQLIYDTDDFLVLAAAGNDGASGAGTVLSPGLGKNVLCVGAAEAMASPHTVAAFSSRGPTSDGRLKPDVMGPGDPVASACASGSAGLASCALTPPAAGTSMATPAVAGAAALVRQFLAEGRHRTTSPRGFEASAYNAHQPSSALLRAILIASTVPLPLGYDTQGNAVRQSSPVLVGSPVFISRSNL
jgi:subtilisin family serine protease